MGKARVPWAKIQKAQGDFIDPKYLPEQITLRQFHHIIRKEADAILKHWTQRQAGGEVPFLFMDVVKATGKKNNTSEKNNANDDTLSGEESEEDMQEGDDSQVPEDGASQGDSSSHGSAEQARPGQSLEGAAENPSTVAWLPKFWR
jgi:hypothetical protein